MPDSTDNSTPILSSLWSDRRGLSQKGREVHVPASPTGRRFPETGVVSDVLRRASIGSNNGTPLTKTTTNGSTAGDQASSTAGRRRSSASSGGMFSNLHSMKRGSEDYGERRASHTEMMSSGGGIMSGWFNETFRGIQRTAAGSPDKPLQQNLQIQQKSGNDNRGVME